MWGYSGPPHGTVYSGYPLGMYVLTTSPVTAVSILGVQASVGRVKLYIDQHSLQNSTHLAEIQSLSLDFKILALAIICSLEFSLQNGPTTIAEHSRKTLLESSKDFANQLLD